jgi:hypothetical protein
VLARPMTASSGAGNAGGGGCAVRCRAQAAIQVALEKLRSHVS